MTKSIIKTEKDTDNVQPEDDTESVVAEDDSQSNSITEQLSNHHDMIQDHSKRLDELVRRLQWQDDARINGYNDLRTCISSLDSLYNSNKLNIEQIAVSQSESNKAGLFMVSKGFAALMWVCAASIAAAVLFQLVIPAIIALL